MIVTIMITRHWSASGEHISTVDGITTVRDGTRLYRGTLVSEPEPEHASVVFGMAFVAVGLGRRVLT